ncbi:MAG: hypothetical protein R3E99_10470 [Burkholderiaceae bacterium]
MSLYNVLCEDAIQRAFADTFITLNRRIALLVNLPIEKLDRLALQSELGKIGQTAA